MRSAPSVDTIFYYRKIKDDDRDNDQKITNSFNQADLLIKIKNGEHEINERIQINEYAHH